MNRIEPGCADLDLGGWTHNVFATAGSVQYAERVRAQAASSYGLIGAVPAYSSTFPTFSCDDWHWSKGLEQHKRIS